jgi:hypothetical protein
MYPYDLDSDSIWEADSWRPLASEGTLELFQTEPVFKAVRAANQTVYPGVRLDRTLVLTRTYLLDIFRVLSDHEHLYDWAWHGFGHVHPAYPTTPVTLSDKRGYRFMANPRRIETDKRCVDLTWQGDSKVHGSIWLPPGSEAILANDPGDNETTVKAHLGGSLPSGPRTALLVRTRAVEAAFVSLWQFATEPGPGILAAVCGGAKRAIEIEIRDDVGMTKWHSPVQKTDVLMEFAGV